MLKLPPCTHTVPPAPLCIDTNSTCLICSYYYTHPHLQILNNLVLYFTVESRCVCPQIFLEYTSYSCGWMVVVSTRFPNVEASPPHVKIVLSTPIKTLVHPHHSKFSSRCARILFYYSLIMTSFIGKYAK